MAPARPTGPRWPLLACVLVSCALPSPLRAEIRLSATEPRSRSAVLEVDAETARRVRPMDVWRAVNPPGGKRLVRFVETRPLEGARCASLTSYERDASLAPELQQVLAAPLESGKAYDLRVQCRGQVGALAELTAYVQTRSGPGEEWATALKLPLLAREGWTETGGMFRGPEGSPEARVVFRLFGKGSAYLDAAWLGAEGAERNLLVDGGFEGVCSWRLQSRKHGDAEWQTDPAVIHEARHTLLRLEASVRYEARAELVNAGGEVLESSVPIYFDTQAPFTREGPGVFADEPSPIGTLGLTAPALAAGANRPILVAAHGGGIYAHVVEFDGSLGEPLQVLPAVDLGGSPADAGDLSACVRGDSLYVLYRLALGPGPADQSLRIVRYDLATGALVGPNAVSPSDPGRSALPGGLSILEGTLWVAYADTSFSAAGPRSRVVLRPYDPATLEPAGDDLALTAPPSEYLYGPSLARLGTRLAVLYSDMAPIEAARSSPREAVEPLYAQFIEAGRVGEPILVCADGRNRRASAVESGGRLAIAWQYGGPEPETVSGEYVVQDIGFAWLGADGAVEGPWSCVHDGTYNESPTLGLVSGRLLTAFRKWEHHPALPDDPAADLGLWSCVLEPSAP